MSNPAEKPEVVQLPAESSTAAPANNRRAAAQRVREARDRLTSIKRNPASFRSRTASAICPDAAVGVLRRHAARGGDRRAVRLLDAAGLGRGMDLRHALHPCRHHPQLRSVHCGPAVATPRPANGGRASSLLDLLYGLVLDRDSDPPARFRCGFQHADDVPDAAGDRGVEHAGGKPADRSVSRHRAGNLGDRA